MRGVSELLLAMRGKNKEAQTNAAGILEAAWKVLRSRLEAAAAGRTRRRKWLSGQPGVALRRVIDEGGHYGCYLAEIVLSQMFIGIHIGMVGAGTVFDLVLDELETGQSNGVERLVIGAAGIIDGHCRGAEVV